MDAESVSFSVSSASSRFCAASMISRAVPFWPFCAMGVKPNSRRRSSAASSSVRRQITLT